MAIDASSFSVNSALLSCQFQSILRSISDSESFHPNPTLWALGFPLKRVEHRNTGALEIPNVPSHHCQLIDRCGSRDQSVNDRHRLLSIHNPPPLDNGFVDANDLLIVSTEQRLKPFFKGWTLLGRSSAKGFNASTDFPDGKNAYEMLPVRCGQCPLPDVDIASTALSQLAQDIGVEKKGHHK